MPANNLDAAHRLAAAGIPVFPENPETKKPFTKHSSATVLERGVRYFWSRYGADALVGIYLSGCGLIVLDPDRGHDDGIDGVENFGLLLDQHGEIPPCPVVRTPRGGIHLYLKQPSGRPPLGLREGELPPGINVRGHGGFVIGPDTVMADGTFYEAIAGTPEFCASFMDGTIPEIAGWLIEIIETGPERSERAPSSPSADCDDDKRLRAYALGTLNGVASDLAGVGVGGRNGRLNVSAYKLGGMCARGWISEAETWDALQWACTRNGYIDSKLPGDGQAQFKATFESGFRSGLLRPMPDPRERLNDQSNIKINLGTGNRK